MKKNFIKDFISFTEKSKSVFHSVLEIEKVLLENKFSELKLQDKWEIKLGGKYFFKRNDSTLIAFTLPENMKNLFFKLSCNHTDTPGFKIKPMPETISEGSYVRFNTEVYGGPILNTWLDRPLSLAGRVLKKGESVFEPITQLVDIDRNLMVIPNIAIHQNREVNDGVKLSKQFDMLPVVSLLNDSFTKENYLMNLIVKECGVEKEEILDMELFLYDRNPGGVFGAENNLILTSKIDNLASAFAGVNGLIESNSVDGINVLACFDNEEVGSRSKQGADSNLLLNSLKRVANSLGKTEEEFYQAIYKSFMISVDGAHAVHPAKGGKADITNRPKLNEGFVIKTAANHAYTSDAQSASVIKRICQEKGIKYQEFVNHSDERGGSTLGPVSAGHLDVNSVDLGIPMLSMHSVKETAGTEDIISLKNLLKEFYSY
ncbi:MAG: M18 family aminopeptidase [Fusobacteriaceae bacterium]